MSVVQGKIVDAIVLVCISGIMAILMLFAMKGRKFELKKKIAGLEAMPEAVGRAVEMGRPTHASPAGGPSMYSSVGTGVHMGMIIVSYVAKLCAKQGSKLIVSVARPEQVSIAQDVIRNAAIFEGVPADQIQPDVRFYSDQGDAPYGSGVIGTLAREKPAINIYCGHGGSDIGIILEAANRLGIYQIAGSTNVTMMPLAVAAAEYALVGEELYAAAAMISGDSSQLATVVAGDIIKLVLISLIVIGSILLMLGIPIMNYLKL